MRVKQTFIKTNLYFSKIAFESNRLALFLGSELKKY
jgi:hypothetical protein